MTGLVARISSLRGQHEQHGKDEDARVLGGEGQPGGEAGDGETEQRGRLHVTVEGIDGREGETGEAGIGSDAGAVGEQVRLEGYEGESEESGAGAEHLLRRKKDQQGEQDGERGGHHAGAEEDGVGVVFEQEIFAVEERLDLEVAALAASEP